MRFAPQPALAVGLLAAVLAITGVIVLGPGGHTDKTADSPQLNDVEPAVEVRFAQAAPSPAPNASPPAPEPELPVASSSVEELIQGTLDAIERDDRAWLARTMESTSGRELTEDDLHAAYRQFLWRSAAPMWDNIRHAWESSDFEVAEQDQTAELVLRMGGALGEMRLKLVRLDGAWCYAGV